MFQKIFALGDTEIDAKLSTYKDIDDSMRSLRLASRTIHISTRAFCCQDTYIVKFIQENYNVDGDPIIQALSAAAEGFGVSGNYWNIVKGMDFIDALRFLPKSMIKSGFETFLTEFKKTIRLSIRKG